MKLLPVIVAALVLGGCEMLQPLDAPKAFVAPDGRPAFSMNCANGMAACHNQARKACDGNYEILNQGESPTYTPADPIAGMPARSGIARSMQVVCASPPESQT